MAGRKKFVEAERGELVNLSDKYTMPTDMRNNIHAVGWDTLANLANDFQVEFEADSVHTRRLAKEIDMTRMIIVDRLKSHSTGSVTLDSKFLVELVKLLLRLEEAEEKHNIKLNSFRNFVYILIEKMKKEKLVVFDRGKYSHSYRTRGLGVSEFRKVPEMEKPLK